MTKNNEEIKEKEEVIEEKPEQKTEVKPEVKAKKNKKSKNVVQDLDEVLGISGKEDIDMGESPEFLKISITNDKKETEEVPEFLKH